MLDSVRTAHTRRECDGAIRKIAQGDNTGLDTKLIVKKSEE